MTICKTDNFDGCYRCDQTPEVDYWKHFKSDRSLCRRCMESEIDDAKYRSKTKSVMVNRLAALKEFQVRRNQLLNYQDGFLTSFVQLQRIRHCSYYHKHDKTTAAIQFVSNRDLKRKFRIENYLSMYE